MKQTAALCLLRLVRANPKVVPYQQTASRMCQLLNERQLVRVPPGPLSPSLCLYSLCPYHPPYVLTSLCPYLPMSLPPYAHTSLCPYLPMSLPPSLCPYLPPYVLTSLPMSLPPSLCPYLPMSLPPYALTSLCPYLPMSLPPYASLVGCGHSIYQSAHRIGHSQS